MNKLNFAVYPAIAVLSLGAAFAAHAQSALDPADSAAYGATHLVYPAAASAAQATAQTASSAKSLVQSVKTLAAKVSTPARNTAMYDEADRLGYGATPTGPSLRTRAEVRAEVLAARASGELGIDVEGGNPTVAQQLRVENAARVVAGSANANVK